MGKSILKDKSYQFAVKVVAISKLLKERKEFELATQLLRCGTSIGANVREAEYAQSKKDFIHKMSIALKEANETEYWIELLNDSKILDPDEYKMLKELVVELLRLLVSTIKTAKNNLHN